VPARLGPVELPATPDEPGDGLRVATRVQELPAREAMRMWCRLVQELMARVVDELERRLEPRCALPRGFIAHLTLAELDAFIGGGPLPADLAERVATGESAPVPAAFRLDDAGHIVAVRRTGRGRLGGRGVSEGRAFGTAIHEVDANVPDDAILVVGSLDPRLAPMIGHVRGIVAETGSVLSHLAILAREQHIPAVVGVPDALDRVPPGSRLALDGRTGEVRPTERTEVTA
jgi:pyruvate,water dikinase